MMKKVPKRRFKGFLNAGDWEQRKLGELGKTFNGLTGKTKKDFGHGDAQYITYLNVFQNTISDLSMTERIEIDKSQNTVQYGDILFTTSSETPEEVGMSSVWLGEKPNTYLNSFCFGYRPTVDIDHQFMGNLLRSPHVRNEMKILAQGISRYNISKNKVMDLEITLPSKEEQKLIGSILNHIDSQLTLHQRKLEKLQATKKALLYELFPIENSRRPKRRFKGFTDDWEQRKLGEVFGCLQNNTLSRDELNYKVPNVKNIHYGDILIKFDEVVDWNSADIPFINNNLDLSKYSNSLLRDGDIVFADTAEDDTVGKAIELQNVKTPYALAGLHTIPCRSLIPFGKGYMGNFLNSESYRCQLRPLMQGIKVSSISKQALKNTTIKYPLDLLEQSQIGNIFFHITTLLTLHQRKLEKLKNLKAAYLNEMFV